MPDMQTGLVLGELLALQKQTLRELRGLRSAMKKDRVPRAESWAKATLSIAAPIATLFATGSVTKALEVLAIIAGR